MNLHHFLATSSHQSAVWFRKHYKRMRSPSVPAPRLLIRPFLWLFLMLRTIYYAGFRILICEPILKAYCARFGRNVHTGVFVPWIEGKGEIILGDRVVFYGKCSIQFASRFAVRPSLKIGDQSSLGHDCSFAIGKRIEIGRNCLIANGVWVFDSSGHSTDSAARLSGLPPKDEEVRPVTIGDNVWIGGRSLIFPGVTIGEGSVVSAGSVVVTDVPPYTIVAGNPARKIGSVSPPSNSSPASPRALEAGH